MHAAHLNSKEYFGDLNGKCARQSKQRRKNKRANLNNKKLSTTSKPHPTINNIFTNDVQIYESIERTLGKIGFQNAPHPVCENLQGSNYKVTSRQVIKKNTLRAFFEKETKSSILIAQLHNTSNTCNIPSKNIETSLQSKVNEDIRKIIQLSELFASNHIFIVIFSKKITWHDAKEIQHATISNRKIITFVVFDIDDADMGGTSAHLRILNCSFMQIEETCDAVTPRGIYRHIVENLAPEERRPIFFTNAPEGAKLYSAST